MHCWRVLAAESYADAWPGDTRASTWNIMDTKTIDAPGYDQNTWPAAPSAPKPPGVISLNARWGA